MAKKAKAVGLGAASTKKAAGPKRAAKPKKPTKVQKKTRDAAAVRANLGATQTVRDFLATTGDLSPDERRQIVEQAIVMLEQVYVHLPLKRAMHAVEPIQRLRLLELKLDLISERAFHDELIEIYTHLRDLHTNYILPAPFNSRSAVLPFRIEEYFEGAGPARIRRYVVTQVAPFVADPHFRPGVEPTHWNGVPIDRAVEVNAEREAGSNLAARHAQGLRAMTSRWMGMSLPPDEEWVVLGYLDGATPREIRFDWQVLLPGTAPTGVDPMTATGPEAAGLGIDVKTEVQRRVLKLLFSPEAMEAERKMADVGAAALVGGDRGAALGVDVAATSVMPDVFSEFRPVETPSGTFGYLRVRTFNVSPEPFVREFIRLAALLPDTGLILDVRGNGGGQIAAGEMLLQVLTPGPVEPERFSLVNTRLTLRLCQGIPFLGAWADSLAQAVATGSDYSQALHLTPPDLCNSIGQVYHGPVLLVTDALCYSTTDMFAAGFQDHGIGPVLGVAASTGAGGANVWTHDFLRGQFTAPDSPFRPIPRGASFRVAIRRSTRVGRNSGVILEDLGVVPDEPYFMTKDDVLHENRDLIDLAASRLAAMIPFALSASFGPPDSPGAARSITATTRNLDRLDVYADDRPVRTLDVSDGPTTFPEPAGFVSRIELRGYRDGRLSASTRLSALAPG